MHLGLDRVQQQPRLVLRSLHREHEAVGREVVAGADLKRDLRLRPGREAPAVVPRDLDRRPHRAKSKPWPLAEYANLNLNRVANHAPVVLWTEI